MPAHHRVGLRGFDFLIVALSVGLNRNRVFVHIELARDVETAAIFRRLAEKSLLARYLHLVDVGIDEDGGGVHNVAAFLDGVGSHDVTYDARVGLLWHLVGVGPRLCGSLHGGITLVQQGVGAVVVHDIHIELLLGLSTYLGGVEVGAPFQTDSEIAIVVFAGLHIGVEGAQVEKRAGSVSWVVVAVIGVLHQSLVGHVECEVGEGIELAIASDGEFMTLFYDRHRAARVYGLVDAPVFQAVGKTCRDRGARSSCGADLLETCPQGVVARVGTSATLGDEEEAIGSDVVDDKHVAGVVGIVHTHV